ncbi:MAG: nitroreductase family protein [Bacteroidetes bacterium]|nr:nitroreductase family protein [Bacteroidota bacterium]MBL6943429.1 nitroreductase family protein [Bacteroidales bacterium]
MIKELVVLNRSYRKFHNHKKVLVEQLTQLVDLARNTPSAKNQQPLKYILVTNENDVSLIESHLKWAAFLKDWNGPDKSEQPPAYIIMLIDKNLNENAYIDAGIAAQTILLGAVEKQMGGCIIRSVNRNEVLKHFNLPSNLEIVQVIAIGYPNQKIELITPDESGSVQYYQDNSGVHYVPKRKLEDVIIIPDTTSEHSG